jgi:hypothetical protein
LFGYLIRIISPINHRNDGPFVFLLQQKWSEESRCTLYVVRVVYKHSRRSRDRA